MNYVLQSTDYVLRQTILNSDLLPAEIVLTDKRVRYLMALGLSEHVARVMAKPQTSEK